MFDSESYRNILESVKEDLKKVENNFKAAVPAHNSLYCELYNYLMAPSKRIRSVLAILYLKARGFHINEEQTVLLAIIELIHNASLLHDDVIDREETRRNKPAFNSKSGNKFAVISGDFLLSIVMEKLCGLNKKEFFEIFSKTIRNMCEGEIIQQTNLFTISSIEDYLKKTYKKTGSLFETAVVCVLFSVSGEYDKSAAEFAGNFGMAFQIKDDLENVLSGGKDIADGIYNAPIIYAGNINNAFAGIEKTKILLNNYLDSCRKHILNFSDSVYKSKILELLELLNG